jgi:hypothetical protein
MGNSNGGKSAENIIKITVDSAHRQRDKIPQVESERERATLNYPTFCHRYLNADVFIRTYWHCGYLV